MTCYEELKARGLIAQVTNEEEISKMINEGKAVFYIGFDPTADSLHVGHFMALCLMKRLQMAGNRPIALIGGSPPEPQGGRSGRGRRRVQGNPCGRPCAKRGPRDRDHGRPVLSGHRLHGRWIWMGQGVRP